MPSSRILEEIAASERKAEIVRCLARGLSVREIAEELEIGETTAKAHITAMRMAFGGIRKRDIPKAWYALTGENAYPDDAELEML